MLYLEAFFFPFSFWEEVSFQIFCRAFSYSNFLKFLFTYTFENGLLSCNLFLSPLLSNVNTWGLVSIRWVKLCVKGLGGWAGTFTLGLAWVDPNLE